MASPLADTNRPIRIKFMGKFKPGRDGEGWLRMFPGRQPVWGNCQFTFDRHCRDYDWLVVYDEMPSAAGERHPLWEEELACPPEHTLLITVEPSTIKVYGSAYLRQFRWLLSTQELWATGPHPGRLLEQPALIWFYADSSPRGDYDTLLRHIPVNKARDLSTVCSSKRQGHTLHRLRYDFTHAIKERLPELDIFGRGIRPLADKADALDSYRYHLAIENFAGRHHWTEKLADAFLGACLPFYYGCPNVGDYFPAESYIPIDIHDVEGSAEIIQRSIRDKAYEQRLPAILESRRLVLENYGPIATISRIVNQHHNTECPVAPPGAHLRSRRLLHQHSFAGARYLAEKLYVRARHALSGD